MRLSVAIVATLLSAAIACQRSENRYLKRSVKSGEVVGRWIVTPTGIEGLRYAGHTNHLNPSDHVMLIRTDGSCFFRGFLDVIKTPSKNESLTSSECTWQIGAVGHQALIVRVREERPATLGPYFYFAERDGKLLLWQYAADPDAWKYVEFSKFENDAKKAARSEED